jgi:hypothetical protein
MTNGWETGHFRGCLILSSTYVVKGLVLVTTMYDQVKGDRREKL